jgi:serine/threonine protein phosphatase Stp1
MNVPPLRLDHQVATHQGCVRTANEDSYSSRPDAAIWAVADGMGGYANGQRASRIVVDAVDNVEASDDFDAECEAIASAIHAANATICTEVKDGSAQMGSTAVALVIRNRRFAVMWVGDSRGYLLRGGVLHQLTKDHSQVQEMIDRGLLTPAQAENHPMGHVLARAIGVQDDIEVDAVSDEALPGDVFLLCSDGLHGVVHDYEMAEVLRGGGGQSAQQLIELSLSRGAPDNVTVAIVSTAEATFLSFGESARAGLQ